jgi:transcriptional regulator with XRE-family HTH domain
LGLAHHPDYFDYPCLPAFPMTKKRPKPSRTQYFSGTLVLLLEKHRLSQVELSAASGIAVSRINNYMHGKYRTIRPDHLEAIAKSASRTKAERGELIRTYLLDLLPEAFQDQIRIESAGDGGGAPVSRVAKLEKSLLPTTTVAALTKLQDLGARSAKARSRLEQFAELLDEAHEA